MPSISTILVASAMALLSSAPLACAIPYHPVYTPIGELKLPSSGLPSSSLKLQYVAVGRGIQNYTCASVGAKPAAIGAIATLYDATQLAEWDLNVVNGIPPKAVNDAPPSPGGDYTLTAPGDRLSVLGHHYFAADGTPTFDLRPVNKMLYSAKNGDVPAPAGASKGPAGTGAVDWLSLLAKTDYVPSVGLGQVYRVETAGGAAPATCPSTNPISVQYSAEYWFYA